MMRGDRLKVYRDALEKYPYLRSYVENWVSEGYPEPHFFIQLSMDMAKAKDFNIIYPTFGPGIFIHIYKFGIGGRKYVAIEPRLDKEMKKKYDEVLNAVLREAPYEKDYPTEIDFSKEEEKLKFIEIMDKLLRRVTTFKEPKTGILKKKSNPTNSADSKSDNNPLSLSKISDFVSRFSERRHPLTRDEFMAIKYYMVRNIVEHGPLEPIIRDPYIEDVHCIGTDQIFIVHKVFGMMETNIRFETHEELSDFLRTMSERIGKPVSDAKPIIDGALPDGSRINIVYSEDVSKKGSSFTIRKFSEKPFTISALVKFGTLSPEIAAYLWLCLEYGMSIIVSGETASGKTTTLNAVLTFINHNHKVYSAEDTPEVVAPHPVWQRLVTRDTGPEGSRVELFDLIRAALRSRPNYIIVGEVRGREGAVMFQAMQTGHSVISTFHAGTIRQMIQRFTGHPINVPIRFFDNLNVALFQQIVYREGRLLRRVISVDEIIRYSKDLDGVLTRKVFVWDPYDDIHEFRGMNNSYILEEKVAPIMNLPDRRMIYEELKHRARIIKNMVDANLVDYDSVNKIFGQYYKVGGYDGIPAELRPPELR